MSLLTVLARLAPGQAALRQQVAMLQADLAAAQAQVAALQADLAAAQAALATAQQRITALEQAPPAPSPAPAGVKPSTPRLPRPPRRKRAAQHNHARRRDPAPTQVVPHPIERCPVCTVRLRGVRLERRRQVLELPPPPSVVVTEHQVSAGWCPQCQRWRSAALDLRGQVLGQGRMGVRLASLVAWLRTTHRLPVRHIQTYLHTMHGLQVSTGEVVELLHQVRRALQGPLDDLLAQVRTSPVVHADETGWRQAGQNGYLWSFSTPGEAAVRYYVYDASRAGAVAMRVLRNGTRAPPFGGVLVSDFYAGYNRYAGPHQRCWVHLCRDLHALVAAQAVPTVTAPVRAAVTAWAQAVRARFDEAWAFVRAAAPPTQAQREQQYVTLMGQVHALGLQYAQAKGHPCQALAQRLLRHEDELFRFVVVAGLAADNNLAERSIRPTVVIRKISGGTQSTAGSTTRLGLASLFGTWQARGLNPFDECLRLLSQPTSPQV